MEQFDGITGFVSFNHKLIKYLTIRSNPFRPILILNNFDEVPLGGIIIHTCEDRYRL